MSFSLVNTFVTFQSYVNRAFKSYINVCYIIYLNDVLIYSKTEKQHWENVCKILRVLLAHRLYAKLSKCAFNYIEISFLDFIISRRDIQMKQSHIDVINEWLISKSAKNILVFLEFANFYRRFIKEFFQIVASLTNLIADAKKNEIKSIFVWNAETQKTFLNLKIAFINVFIL